MNRQDLVWTVNRIEVDSRTGRSWADKRPHGMTIKFYINVCLGCTHLYIMLMIIHLIKPYGQTDSNLITYCTFALQNIRPRRLGHDSTIPKCNCVMDTESYDKLPGAAIQSIPYRPHSPPFIMTDKWNMNFEKLSRN